jgi:hypothetical protein
MAIVYICQEWRAKATDKPAYPPGLKPQRLAAGFVLSASLSNVCIGFLPLSFIIIVVHLVVMINISPFRGLFPRSLAIFYGMVVTI